nr:reverse transcriptase domain-containing protein [Tanacetum cinerariifolium]
MFAHSNDSRRQLYHSNRIDTESCYQSSRSRGTEPASEKHHNKKASSHKTEALSKSKAAKVERWAMPKWWHMFDSTLTGSARVWFDDLPPESLDSYDDLKEAFLANFRQKKKCIKDPVEIHHIKQNERESTEDFVRRFKVESRDVKGAPKIMRILGFMHGITNPKQIKRLHDKISKSVDEMMRITTSFLRGEVAAVRSSSSYNGIIGRPRVRKIQAVSSTTHVMLKFPIARGVLILKSSKIIPIECAAVSGPEGQPPAAHQAIEERIKVAINPYYPEQTIMIESTLTEEGRKKLCDLIQRNLDVFDWKPADMTGVSRHMAEHRLNIRERCPPVRQKRISQAADRNQLIQKEVENLIRRDVPRLQGQYQRNIGMSGQSRCCFKSSISEMFEGRQKLNGKLASLNRFLAKSTEKSLPFFKTLKKCIKKSDFHWTEEAKAAFKQMKQLIAKLPTLITPAEKEELVFYLAAAKEVVSAVLMTEKEAKKMPTFFVSLVLRGPKVNYTSMEKLVLALGQILADFIVERPEEDDPDTPWRSKKNFQNRGFGLQMDRPVHIPIPRNPQQKLTPITSPWPFYKWEIDINGPFSKSPVIPAEIGMPTLRTAELDIVQNDEALEINLDLLKEKREHAAIREAKSKAKMENYYNSKCSWEILVKSPSFALGIHVFQSRPHLEVSQIGIQSQGYREPVKSMGSSFPRVILLGSISVEVPVTPEVRAAAVASPAEVLKLDTYSSLEAVPSESSPPLEDIPIVRLYRTHPGRPCRALIARKSVRPFPSHSLALRYISHHLDHFTSESLPSHSSSDHSSSGHSITGHSLSRHTPLDTTEDDSSTPLIFVDASLARTPRCSEAYLLPSCADLLPPCKRFRDSISLEDSVEEDIDTDVLEDIEADAMAVEVAVDRDVEAGVDTSIDIESSDRGTMEVGVDVVTRVDIPDDMIMPDAVEHLKQVEKGHKELEARSLIAGGERVSLLDQNSLTDEWRKCWPLTKRPMLQMLSRLKAKAKMATTTIMEMVEMEMVEMEMVKMKI